MVLRQRRQGEERAREYVRAVRLVQRQGLDREDKGLGSGPRRLEAASTSSAVKVELVGQRPGRHERERDGIPHPQHLHQNVQVSHFCKLFGYYFFKKNIGRSRPLFLYFCLFNTVESTQMFNMNFDNEWIRTAELWYWKRLLHQLSHNTALF